MKNRTNQALSSWNSKLKILELCESPKNFTELKKEIGFSNGALTYHLKHLIQKKLIIKKIVEKDGKRKRGNEITLKTNHKFSELDSHKKEKRKLLSLINPKISKKELKEKISKDNYFKNDPFIFAKINGLNLIGLTKETITLTAVGKKILKENNILQHQEGMGIRNGRVI